jgi:hypothetical protein
MRKPSVPGSWKSELRQPGTSTFAGESMRPCGSRTLRLCHCSRPRRFEWPPARPRCLHELELVCRRSPARPPSCRTESELRPLATARPRRFEWSAWGTQEFLGRGAQGPQPPGRGKRPGGFDPEELFGAAFGLTQKAESRGAANKVRVCGPVVTTRKRTYVFCGDVLSLDIRGHRVVWLENLRSPLFLCRPRSHHGGFPHADARLLLRVRCVCSRSARISASR